MENRANWVDYSKGIGIILVVYGHVTRGLFEAGISFDFSMYKLIDSIIYTFHMPLFFFLSGIFFSSSLQKRGMKNLVFSKIDTIFYPYILWSLFQGGIKVTLSEYTNSSLSYVELYTILWEPKAQFWFLHTLFLVFLLSAFISSVIKIKNTFILLFVTSSLYLYSPQIELKILKLLSENIVFFYVGIFFTLNKTFNFLESQKALVISTILFICAQWVFHEYLTLTYEDKGIETLMVALLSIIFLVSLSMNLPQKKMKLLGIIGSSSMAIYLMHILIGSGSRIILQKIFNINALSIHLVIGCLMGMLIPILVTIYMKKINIKYLFEAPLSRWVFRNSKS